MKVVRLEPSYIKPLLALSAWICTHKADTEEWFDTHIYRVDDYGNLHQIKPLSVWGFEKAGYGAWMHH